jgi:hypothetical protein
MKTPDSRAMQADEFHRHAEECHRLAQNTLDAATREALTELASQYEWEAEQLEARSGAKEKSQDKARRSEDDFH